MRDDTVTPSPRAPFKDSSPCQKPPPPHAEPTVWGAMGQVVLNQHFKAAPLSIIRGCVPSSLRTWVSFDYRDVRSMCVTSEDDITLPGGRHG